MAKRRNNRNAGHRWEREILHDLQEIFPDCKTSRQDSRSTDARKVDFTGTEPAGFAFQAKKSAGRINYDQILEEMDTVAIKVVLNKLTEKRGSNFMTKGKYAIMSYNDFLELLKGYLTYMGYEPMFEKMQEADDSEHAVFKNKSKR